VAKPSRSAPCGATEARARLRTAEAYMETAELRRLEARDGFANVTAGLAVGQRGAILFILSVLSALMVPT
jgi:hypothetical protein